MSIFGCLLIIRFFWGTIYIYIFCARRLHDLFVHFGRNAFRMRSMHSECIPAQYQDPRSKIPTRLLAKILEIPRSKIPTRLLAKILEIPRSKIQDLHRSLVENLGNTKIQDPRFPQDSWLKSWILDLGISKIFHKTSVQILDLGISKIFHKTSVQILDLGSWYFQDFSQESCGNLGSWILVLGRNAFSGILWAGIILRNYSTRFDDRRNCLCQSSI